MDDDGVVCPFGQPVGPEEAIDFCPRGHECPCRLELLCHALGEVDAQTMVVARFWQPRATFNCGWRREKLHPSFARDVLWPPPG